MIAISTLSSAKDHRQGFDGSGELEKFAMILSTEYLPKILLSFKNGALWTLVKDWG